jgi:hypothetical protein
MRKRSLRLPPQTAVDVLSVEGGNHVPLPYALISPSDSCLWRGIWECLTFGEETIEVSELAGGEVGTLCGERVILEGAFLLEGEVGGSAQSFGLNAFALSHGVLEEGGGGGIPNLLQSQCREGTEFLLLHLLFGLSGGIAEGQRAHGIGMDNLWLLQTMGEGETLGLLHDCRDDEPHQFGLLPSHYLLAVLP